MCKPRKSHILKVYFEKGWNGRGCCKKLSEALPRLPHSASPRVPSFSSVDETIIKIEREWNRRLLIGLILSCLELRLQFLATLWCKKNCAVLWAVTQMKERENSLQQRNLYLWLHHPSPELPLPIIAASYCLFALQQPMYAMLLCWLCVYAPFPCYMAQRTEFLSHIVCWCLFSRVFRRWCFCVWRGVKKIFFGANVRVSKRLVHSLLIARKLIASICRIVKSETEKYLRKIIFIFNQL